MCIRRRFRSRHVTFSPAISVLGEATETIWRQVNMAIVKSSLRFDTIVHWSFLFSLKKKSPFTWNFKCRWDKRLVACWRPVLKFWSLTPNFWSHWRPVSRNFGPCNKAQVVCICVCICVRNWPLYIGAFRNQ